MLQTVLLLKQFKPIGPMLEILKKKATATPPHPTMRLVLFYKIYKVQMTMIMNRVVAVVVRASPRAAL